MTMDEDKLNENSNEAWQAENSSDPITNSDAGQSTDSDKKISTGNMEVHHHAGHHEKKKGNLISGNF